MLQIKNLTKIYNGSTEALSNVNLTIKKGEFVCLLGLSGSGKSTLLRCINGLQKPTHGKVIFKNENITDLKSKNLRFFRSQIGMIFQQFNLIERKTVLSNTLMGCLFRSPLVPSLFDFFPEKEKKKALKTLTTLGLIDKINERVSQLSGGQKQRVAIARALMQNPSLILADEPISSLDPKTAKKMMNFLKMINQTLGVTIFCSLHNTSLVRDYANRVITLESGRVSFDSPTLGMSEDDLLKVYGKK
jgi:phosphonate transport system ATP-binding protein